MALIVLLCEMSWSFAFVFVVCEFGQIMSNAYTEIDHEVCQLDWYLFSMEIQKILPTLMIVTQKPVGLDVFGNISCGREDFKKVSKIGNKLEIFLGTQQMIIII